jgi:hypothetical protein
VQLRWGYPPNSFDRQIADEWVAACACRLIDDVNIAEHDVSLTGRRAADGHAVTVTVKRHWDLAADLSEAVSGLRRRLE